MTWLYIIFAKSACVVHLMSERSRLPRFVSAIGVRDE